MKLQGKFKHMSIVDKRCPMDVQLREDGIHYELAYKNRKVSFPLASDEKLCKKIYKTEEWSHYV